MCSCGKAATIAEGHDDFGEEPKVVDDRPCVFDFQEMRNRVGFEGWGRGEG